MKAKVWFQETRPQFLILSIVLAFLGGAVSAWRGSFSLLYTILAGTGILFLHAAVDVLNDYFDYRSGLDLKTERTPFSGGSGILPEGRMKARHALIFGLVLFLLVVPIGGFFLWLRGLALLPLLVFGALAVLLYSTVFQKIPFGIPELVAGLGLGTLPVWGVCFVNQGVYDTRALFAAVPSGLLVFNLLLLNEFPDREADAQVGRRNLPVQFGRKAAAIVYTVFELGVYAWIGAGILTHLLPAWSALSFLTLPLALQAITGAAKWETNEALRLRALGSNVMVVLATQVLLGVGLLLA